MDPIDPTRLHATEAEFREIVLDRVKLASRLAISREIWEDTTIRTMFDWMADQLIVQIEAEILAQKHYRHSRLVEWSFPSSPWQHVKARLGGRFGRWIRRTWPVVETLKHVRIDYEAQTMFPEATVRYPKDLGPQVRAVLDTPHVWTD